MLSQKGFPLRLRTDQEAILEAIRGQTHWRRNYHPDDPPHIIEEIKRSPEYIETMVSLKKDYRSLLAFLEISMPFFSILSASSLPDEAYQMPVFEQVAACSQVLQSCT